MDLGFAGMNCTGSSPDAHMTLRQTPSGHQGQQSPLVEPAAIGFSSGAVGSSDAAAFTTGLRDFVELACESGIDAEEPTFSAAFNAVLAQTWTTLLQMHSQQRC